MGLRSLPARILTFVPRWITRQILLMTAGVIGLVLALLYAATSVLGVRIDGESMQPTLHNGDRVVLRPFSGGDLPDRFDLIVGRFAADKPEVVKRVIGLPGDRVLIATAKAGAPAVRVQPGASGPWFVVTNPAWEGQWGAGVVRCCRKDGLAARGGRARVVPAGMLFLLGDNPIGSLDSRAFGWAPVDLLDGVVTWRVRPLTSLGGVGGDVVLTPTVDNSAPRRPR